MYLTVIIDRPWPWCFRIIILSDFKCFFLVSKIMTFLIVHLRQICFTVVQIDAIDAICADRRPTLNKFARSYFSPRGHREAEFQFCLRYDGELELTCLTFLLLNNE